MKVLFWNTQKNKNINYVLCELIEENSVDFIFLAEYDADIEELKRLLYSKGIFMKNYPTIGFNKITVIGKEMDIIPGKQSNYMSFQIINNKDIYCCVHLTSRIYSSGEGMRITEIDEVLQEIKRLEQELNSDNTIVVGDFNSNPFDSECLDANFFHGIPIYEVAKKGIRTIASKEYKMFYNPMWSFLGDKQKPYGTYYFAGNNISNSFWHILDQVIIRPCLKDRFVDSSLKIITETKYSYLLNNRGRPDGNISDHLPIIFEIKEENNG